MFVSIETIPPRLEINPHSQNEQALIKSFVVTRLPEVQVM